MVVLDTTLWNQTGTRSIPEASEQYENQANRSRAYSTLALKRFYAFILLEVASNFVINNKNAFLFMEHGLNEVQLELALDYLEQIHYPTGSTSERTH